jgi:hypothetical protein
MPASHHYQRIMQIRAMLAHGIFTYLAFARRTSLSEAEKGQWLKKH